MLPEHCEEGGEKGDGKTGVQDTFDLDGCSWRATPLWQGGNVTAEGGIVDLVDEDPKESGGLFIWVRLQLGVDLDDECRGHGREQTSLSFMSACIRCILLQTHEYQGRVQILIITLHEFFVVFFGLLAVVSVEFSPKILLARPRVLPWAMGEISVWIRRDVRLDATHRPVVHPPLHLLLSPVLLQDPDWDQMSEIKDIADERTTVRRYRVLAGVVQVAGSSAFPGTKIQVISKGTSEGVIQTYCVLGVWPSPMIPPLPPSLLIHASGE